MDAPAPTESDTVEATSPSSPNTSLPPDDDQLTVEAHRPAFRAACYPVFLVVTDTETAVRYFETTSVGPDRPMAGSAIPIPIQGDLMGYALVAKSKPSRNPSHPALCEALNCVAYDLFLRGVVSERGLWHDVTRRVHNYRLFSQLQAVRDNLHPWTVITLPVVYDRRQDQPERSWFHHYPALKPSPTLTAGHRILSSREQGRVVYQYEPECPSAEDEPAPEPYLLRQVAPTRDPFEAAYELLSSGLPLARVCAQMAALGVHPMPIVYRRQLHPEPLATRDTYQRYLEEQRLDHDDLSKIAPRRVARFDKAVQHAVLTRSHATTLRTSGFFGGFTLKEFIVDDVEATQTTDRLHTFTETFTEFVNDLDDALRKSPDWTPDFEPTTTEQDPFGTGDLLE